jgi:hypothetical protein
MATEFDKFKANKIVTLKNIYNINLTNLKIKYNNELLKIRRANVPARNKNNAIRILTNTYINETNNFKNKLNSDILTVQNMIIDSIYIKNNQSSLLIGINYIGTNYQLNGCINDATSIQKLSLDSGFKNVVLLSDNSIVKPTKVNILNELKNILLNSNAGDLLIFAYSGHGTYTRDINGDEQDGRDEMILPIDFNPIKDDELKSIIQSKLKKDVTIFCLFDSCHSGTVMDLKYQYYDSSNFNNYTENDKTTETNGNIIMISGCSDNQTSMDSFFNGKAQGALTWSFLESLKQLQNPSWRELLLKMRDLLKNNNYTQIPQLSSGKFFDINTKVFL